MIWGFLAAALIGGPALADGETGAPEGVRVEAEDPKPASTCTVIDDADASGGQAVTSRKPWEPIFASPTPEGDRLAVWIRRRGGPVCLKAVHADGQKELQWAWSEPEEWTWTRMGAWTREELGDHVVIIRGEESDADDPAVDCVVFVPADAPEPAAAPPPAARPGFQPRAELPADRVDIAIDWDQAVGRVTARHWGVNCYEMAYPQRMGDPGLQSYLASLGPALVRVHHGDLANKWTDADARAWDTDAIRQAFDHQAFDGAQIMLNIPEWPKWLHDRGPLPAEKYDAFLELIGDLVRLLRDEVGVEIAYWEVLNERDNMYEKADRLDELWDLQNRVMAAIRAADPAAKVGGPALTWPKPAWVEGFLTHSGDRVDFITWHNYASGQPTLPNADLFERLDTLEGHAAHVLEAIDRHGLDPGVETFLTEYNVQWTWSPFERRHANNLGAAFQAGVVRRMALLGVDGVAVWHAKGNAYGLIDGDNRLRAPGLLYRWGHRYLTGPIAAVAVSDPAALEVLPVMLDDGERSVMLVNKREAPIVVRSAAPLLPASARRLAIDADSGGQRGPAPADRPLTLPGWSVTLLTTAPDATHEPADSWRPGPEIDLQF